SGVIFFFSSRRRHTRSKRDWSSDVCSSDLKWNAENATGGDAYKSIIKEVDGEKIGIFGLTTEDTVNIASPLEVTFTNYIEAAERSEERRVGKECRCRWWGGEEKGKGVERRE